LPFNSFPNSLKVNVNTIRRVYSELKREGVLSAKQGRGTFVIEKKNSHLFKRNNERLDQLIDDLFIEAFELGYDLDQLLEYIQGRCRLPDE
jgi:GntR family transcriptional regulator